MPMSSSGTPRCPENCRSKPREGYARIACTDETIMTAKKLPPELHAAHLTIWAVTCTGDPYEERPAHFVSADAESAIARYASVYRGETRADEVDLEKLADEADAAGDDAQARDCRLAMEGDQVAMRRVCAALG